VHIPRAIPAQLLSVLEPIAPLQLSAFCVMEELYGYNARYCGLEAN